MALPEDDDEEEMKGQENEEEEEEEEEEESDEDTGERPAKKPRSDFIIEMAGTYVVACSPTTLHCVFVDHFRQCFVHLYRAHCVLQ